MRKDKTFRPRLQALGNTERHTFTATFVRFGTKHGWQVPERTVLLSNVKLGTETVADHLWFTCGKTWDQLDLQAGDSVQFDARVGKYQKGYQGYREDVYKPRMTDYRLERPTKASKLPPDN